MTVSKVPDVSRWLDSVRLLREFMERQLRSARALVG